MLSSRQIAAWLSGNGLVAQNKRDTNSNLPTPPILDKANTGDSKNAHASPFAIHTHAHIQNHAHTLIVIIIYDVILNTHFKCFKKLKKEGFYYHIYYLFIIIRLLENICQARLSCRKIAFP